MLVLSEQSIGDFLNGLVLVGCSVVCIAFGYALDLFLHVSSGLDTVRFSSRFLIAIGLNSSLGLSKVAAWFFMGWGVVVGLMAVAFISGVLMRKVSSFIGDSDE